jgi:putative hemolysin
LRLFPGTALARAGCMDVALLVFLILLNGLFAMSELALTASRKARLQVMLESGEGGAQAALDLHDNPTKFLSTVQIGITSIGVLNGIVGEAAFAGPLSDWLEDTFPFSPHAANLTATGLVVVIITYLTIIFGELVPKRLGLMYPETIARRVALPMEWLSKATRPFVWVLTVSTNATLRLFGIKGGPSRGVTEEEIAASLEEGLETGIIEAQEHQMVRNVFRLDERQIGSMMIPRSDIVWLDAAAPLADALVVIAERGHSRYPVCRGGLDDVLGVLAVQDLLTPLARGDSPALAECVRPPVFVPETLTGMELLEHFRAESTDMVFVVDEYGEVQGVIGVRDLLEAITGEFVAQGGEDAWAVRRDDGSWLLDGLMPVTEMKDRLDLKALPQEDEGRYNTVAGMVMLLLGELPKTADKVEWDGWSFEVMDLDGKRVDKVLAVPGAVEETGETG